MICTKRECFLENLYDLSIDSVRIAAGIINLKASPGKIIERKVIQFEVHPNFLGNRNNDIAILVLESPLEYNQFVSPICLPTLSKMAKLEMMKLDRKIETGITLSVSGWGDGKSGALQNIVTVVYSQR